MNAVQLRKSSDLWRMRGSNDVSSETPQWLTQTNSHHGSQRIKIFPKNFNENDKKTVSMSLVD